MNFLEINQYMKMASDLALDAKSKDEVPVGALIVSPFGEILSMTHNLKETDFDPTSHAEILAIQQASKELKNWRLIDCSMFVTLEPCPMCLSAIVQSRVKNLYFGAYDKKGGAISLGYNFHNDSRLNHKLSVFGGFNHFESSQLLSNFFRMKRNQHNASGE